MERVYWLTGEVLIHFNWYSRETIRRKIAFEGFPAPVYFGKPGKSPAYYLIEACLEWERTHAQTFSRKPIKPPKKKGREKKKAQEKSNNAPPQS